MDATVVLMTPRGDVPVAEFAQRCRDAAVPLAERLSAGRARVLTADVDQSPLLGSEVNETRPDAFAAAIVFAAPLAEDPGRHAGLAQIGTSRSYCVEHRAIKNAPSGSGSASDPPGFSMVSPVFRAAALSHAEFDAHWRDRHAPLALKHHVGMWRYDQHAVTEVLTPGAPAFDGIATLSFESVEDYEQRLFDSNEGRDIIMADTRRFLDLARSEAALMREQALGSPF
jgi:uncharacterized protein (TIGR02118 family)